ncbi:MAG: glycoside hydrolase family 78 protein [Gorillibacterium sp.]|nr:glycoside hydrolase family 78 protein [Gorillibacterium sp.]
MDLIGIYDPCCEYKHNPIGTDERHPRLSWKLDAGEARNIKQTAYRIQVALEEDFEQPLWDTGKVVSDQSVHVEYAGPELASRTRYNYRIQVWTDSELASAWSETAYWETAFLTAEDWQAHFITGVLPEVEGEDPCHYLRKSFSVKAKVESARIYATALGIYRLYVNGVPADDTLFAPGWTSYRKRLQYQTYDVTHLLVGDEANKENVLGVMLGNGWYKGDLAWEGKKEIFGDTRALLLQMHVVYADGSEEMVITDDSWTYSTEALRMSELYHGETYDARLTQAGWNQAGFTAAGWNAAVLYPYRYETLVAQENNPVRIVEELQPIAILTTPKGETVYDLGQNMVGWVRFTIRAQQGTVIKLTHAEVLDQAGNFYTTNLRSAKQTITYICQGNESETYEPFLSFQGFRYVRVEGLPSDGTIEQITGCVIHTDLTPTGSFACSDEMINQLQHNIIWGQKGNFLDVPTDCPQRDERLGWTGDAQAFVRTAAFNFNVANFFTKWLRDLAADQQPDGGVPHVIPDVPAVGYSSAAWGDAAVICPWTIYESYGDERILENQFESMKAWVEYIRAQGENEFLWNTGSHFGDWLGLDAKENSYIGATPRDLIATAFFAYSTQIVAKAAAVIGKYEEASTYETLHQNISRAFCEEFVTPSGRVASPTQTAYALALMFDLLEEKDRARTAGMLAAHIEENGTHLTTGFVGTPYLCLVLTRFGYTDLAYQLALQKEYPSWLYSVSKGATTIWEHWDGIKPDGSFWSENMNSYNHYAYGAIGEWFYRKVAGIDTVEANPGYKKIRIQPHIGEALSYAEATKVSLYGEIKAGWIKLEDGMVEMSITIPANTEAEVILPVAESEHIQESGQPLDRWGDLRELEKTEFGIRFIVGSGSYRITFPG